MRREVGPGAIILLIGFLAFFKEPRFLQPESISSILLWVPMLAIAGLGQMLVIVSRGIDVSVGSIAGFSAMAMGIAFKSHPEMNLFLGALIAMGAGLTLGSFNGLLISVGKVPPIIMTLGGLSAYRGLTFILSKGKQIDSNDLPDRLTNLSSNGPIRLGAVTLPWVLLIGLGVAVVIGYLARCTKFGRDIFAIGGNPTAAELRGIPVKRVIFLIYALTGALAGLTGLIYASRFGFVNAGSAGKGLELSIIAAVVIGGTKVTGGSGSVLGVLLGSLLLGMLNVALAVLGTSEEYQAFVYGVIILISLFLDTGFQRWFAVKNGVRA